MSRCTLWRTLRRISGLASIIVAGAALLPALVSAEQVVGSIKTRVRQGASPAVPVVYAERLDAPTPDRPGAFTMAQFLPGTWQEWKVNGNPDHFPTHTLIKHGHARDPVELADFDTAPREFYALAAWLAARPYLEGIVWHHPDGRMAKLKRRDYPAALLAAGLAA